MKIKLKALIRMITESIYTALNNKILGEGIDISKTKEHRTVSVNTNHQDMVDTNNPHNPYLFKTEVSYTNYKNVTTLSPVYSIFERKATADGSTDGNPLLSALKKRKQWEFANAKRDLPILLRRFVVAAKLLPKYDTIIMTPSNNELNKIVFGYLKRIIPHDNAIDNFFVKLSADDVEDNFVDEKYINGLPNSVSVWNALEDAFSSMRIENGGVFSYKYIQVSAYRKAIKNSLKVNSKGYATYYEDIINGKNVLVFDDTVTSGKTISDSGNAITGTFTPKSITFITLFSALNKMPNTINKVSEV